MRNNIYNWAGALLVTSISILAFVGVIMLLLALDQRVWSDKGSGWVQAIGSIVAILASFFLFSRQRQHELQQARDDELAQRTRSVQAIQDVVYHSIGAVYRCIQSYEGQHHPGELSWNLDRVNELRAMLDRFVDPRAERIVNLTAMLFSNALAETKSDYLFPVEHGDDLPLRNMKLRHGEMLEQQMKLISVLHGLEQQCRERGIEI